MKILFLLLDILFPPLRSDYQLPNAPATAFTCPECRGRLPMQDNGPPPLRLRCHPRADYLLVAVASYSDSLIRSLTHELKFKRRRALAVPMGRSASAAIALLRSRIDCIVPIPLSRRRERSRGFNQSGLIAVTVSQESGIPCRVDLLMRNRHSGPQTFTKTWTQRKMNLKDSFAVVDTAALKGKTILLVDDVWTSGATMGAAARALKAAGAAAVIGLAIARA